MMISIEDKAALILAQEKGFADSLALKVLDRPKLSVWMILIPIIFVYFFYRYQKFSNGKKIFSENYLISKKRALNEAVTAIKDGRKPDIEGIARESDMPQNIRVQHADVLAILVDHYTDLLQAEGESFKTLIRSVYKTRTNYLLYINRLNRAEKIRNAALAKQLVASTENVAEVVQSIQVWSEKLRRNRAEEIFPQ